MVIIYLFNNDLRLNDNSGFNHALEDAKTTSSASAVIPLFIRDNTTPWPVQGAAAWWLHHSLQSLSVDLKSMGQDLCLRSGKLIDILSDMINQHHIDGIYFSRAYDPVGIEQQKNIYTFCLQHGIACKRFSGSLLFEPETIKSQKGNYFQVFTPFYRHAKTHLISNSSPLKKNNLSKIKTQSEKLNQWQLLPTKPNWAKEFTNLWTPGEAGAQQQLQTAIDDIISDYKDQRDIPSIEGTSQLSAHLRFGEINPRQIWQQVSAQLSPENAESFLRQIFWREFNHHLLFHLPHIPNKPFKEKFSYFPWKKNNHDLTMWQQGKTGYPIVDAGMRQLWQTGWMHNRVRMIVASFLTKHLGIHWQDGAAWFWDTLVDADLANNSGGWQWVAGCGADASPYFRIFNPVLQGNKFDPNGEYIKQWVPELSELSKKFIHSPWTAPKTILQSANIKLGETYPEPIVDHKSARERALADYAAIKNISYGN